MIDAEIWRKCSSCKAPLAFAAAYYRCSVSTCNRKPLELTFCSLPCWEAHVPEMRHREAWAEEARAPTAEAYAAEQAEAQAQAQEAARPRRTVPDSGEAPAATLADDLPREVLIVVSKLKRYIKARSGMNTSDSVIEVLSDKVREACDQAIRRAGQADRRTVMARDFEDGEPDKPT